MTLSDDQVLDLRDLARIWPTDMVLIGAAALSAIHGMPWRSTSDLDLVLAIELEDLDRPLPPGWRRRRHEHEIVGARGTHFDVIPASPRLRTARKLTWRAGFDMNLTGIDLAFEHAVEHDLGGHRLRVAPRTVIAILKMVAYSDRPHERMRDLRDLAHLLDEYVGDDDDRRWVDAIGVDFDLVSAYLLGRDVGVVVAGRTELADVIEWFLVRVEGRANGELCRQAPRAWRRDDDTSLARLAAFRRGLAGR